MICVLHAEVPASASNFCFRPITAVGLDSLIGCNSAGANRCETEREGRQLLLQGGKSHLPKIGCGASCRESSERMLPGAHAYRPGTSFVFTAILPSLGTLLPDAVHPSGRLYWTAALLRMNASRNRELFGCTVSSVHPKAFGAEVGRPNTEIGYPATDLSSCLRVMCQSSAQDSIVLCADAISYVVLVEQLLKIGFGITVSTPVK